MEKIIFSHAAGGLQFADGPEIPAMQRYTSETNNRYAYVFTYEYQTCRGI